jgi:broad specificity phosphatase PhoE
MKFRLGFVNATVYIEAMLHLFLIRHGETEWNRLGRFQGVRDIPLNDEGRRQARALAQTWDQELDLVFSSPLSRARDTALILAESRGLKVEIPDVRLAERAYGEGEGLTLAERKDRFGDYVPGMEAPESVRARGLEFLKSIEERTGRIAAVSHGGLINALLWAISEGAVGTGRSILPNASVSEIVLGPRGWFVSSVGRTFDQSAEPLGLRE